MVSEETLSLSELQLIVWKDSKENLSCLHQLQEAAYGVEEGSEPQPGSTGRTTVVDNVSNGKEREAG